MKASLLIFILLFASISEGNNSEYLLDNRLTFKLPNQWVALPPVKNYPYHSPRQLSDYQYPFLFLPSHESYYFEAERVTNHSFQKIDISSIPTSFFWKFWRDKVARDIALSNIFLSGSEFGVDTNTYSVGLIQEKANVNVGYLVTIKTNQKVGSPTLLSTEVVGDNGFEDFLPDTIMNTFVFIPATEDKTYLVKYTHIFNSKIISNLVEAEELHALIKKLDRSDIIETQTVATFLTDNEKKMLNRVKKYDSDFHFVSSIKIYKSLGKREDYFIDDSYEINYENELEEQVYYGRFKSYRTIIKKERNTSNKYTIRNSYSLSSGVSVTKDILVTPEKVIIVENTCNAGSCDTRITDNGKLIK